MKRALMLVAFAAGCAHHHQATGILVLHVAPPDARVSLDDRYIGSAAVLSKRPMRLNVGHRRVEVTAEGHYSARREVDVVSGGQAEMSIELRPVPEGQHE